MENPLSDLPGYELRRASLFAMGELGALFAARDLRVTEVSVLLVIGENSGASQSDIGRLLGIKRANMAPLCARLEQRELIRRLPMDGRSHGLALTDEGAVVVKGLRRDIHAFEDVLIARVPLEHRQSFIIGLKAIRS
jgi:DNA-binding MarR family transcriptional regulator